jgi:hypothetical protein
MEVFLREPQKPCLITMQITTMCKYQYSPEFSRFLQPTEYELPEKLLAADFHSIV